MIADSNSHVAWHRVQLKKNRDALKAIEVSRFKIGQMSGPSAKARQEEIASLKRKIAESERCIAVFERQTRRPMSTDFGSLTQVLHCAMEHLEHPPRHGTAVGGAATLISAVIPGQPQRVGAFAPPDDRLRAEPGIHNPRGQGFAVTSFHVEHELRGYGFRARARARPGMTSPSDLQK
jgi:hypothetical protein